MSEFQHAEVTVYTKEELGSAKRTFSLTKDQLEVVQNVLLGNAAPVWREREVTSDSDPRTKYVVSQNTRYGDIRCTCPGYHYRKSCKHVDEVRRSS